MSLLSPLFLLGLGALAVPVIVHLVRRTRAPQVDFPSLMFVRRVPQRTIRRKRLHNLLLLALRALAIVLAVLAFARPFLPGSGAEAMQRDRSNVILVDTSLTMRQGGRFEKARTRALGIVSQIEGEKGAIVAFNRGYEVLEKLSTDTGKLRAALTGLQPSNFGTDIMQALKGAESLFADDTSGAKRIFLISDFQASGKGEASNAFRLKGDIKLEVVDISDESIENIAISDLGVHGLVYQQKYSDKLTAKVTNFGLEDRRAVRVEFRINDSVIEKREVDVPAGESKTLEFTDFNVNDGVNRCQLDITDDAFTFDNRFSFTIRRSPQVKVLIIETATRGQSESFYLKNALTTGENLPFALTVKSSGSANPAELSEYGVVILNDPGEINSALATQLVKFVEGGGGLVVSTGPHTRADAFNRSFGTLSPTVLDEAVQARTSPVTLSEIRTDHPIFEVFRQSGRLASIRFAGYFRSAPRETSSVIARFQDGSPALVEAATGKGKVILFTSTLDSFWNDLPLTPVYLPLVRQIVRYLGEREERPWHIAGQPFTVAALADGSLPAVDSPGGARLTERTQSSLGDLIVNPREPGFYRIRLPQASDYEGVNIPALESDLKKMDVQEFVTAVTGSQAEDPSRRETLTQRTATSEEIESGQRVWWLLLLAAFVLFVSEAILSRRLKTARIINSGR
jgi:Aerotolerance regulator N-terminal/von Willebrand factor type A domain